MRLVWKHNLWGKFCECHSKIISKIHSSRREYWLQQNCYANFIINYSKCHNLANNHGFFWGSYFVSICVWDENNWTLQFRNWNWERINFSLLDYSIWGWILELSFAQVKTSSFIIYSQFRSSKGFCSLWGRCLQY